jgi:hypothetical protein
MRANLSDVIPRERECEEIRDLILRRRASAVSKDGHMH